MNLLLTTNYSAIVDIVALVFIFIFALWGCMRGFTKTFFAVFGKIIALILAVLLAPTAANFLQEKFSVVTSLSGSVNGVLTSMFGEQIMGVTLEQATSDYLSSAGLAGFIIEIILTLRADTSVPTSTTLAQIVAPTFAYYIVVIICVIAFYIIFRLIFFFISEIINKWHKWKPIASIDESLGFALGIINGIISLEFLILAIKIIPIALFQDIYAAIQTSTVAGFIENINVFSIIINSLSTFNITSVIKGLIG